MKKRRDDFREKPFKKKLLSARSMLDQPQAFSTTGAASREARLSRLTA